MFDLVRQLTHRLAEDREVPQQRVPSIRVILEVDRRATRDQRHDPLTGPDRRIPCRICAGNRLVVSVLRDAWPQPSNSIARRLSATAGTSTEAIVQS